MMSEETNDQIEQRRANIRALETAGREPFPTAWTPTHVTSDVARSYEEQHGDAREPDSPVRVSIAGRMTASLAARQFVNECAGHGSGDVA